MALQQSSNKLEDFAKFPLWGKLLIAAVLAGLISGGNYYFFIQDFDKKIKTADKKISQNEKEIMSQKVIAENLTQFQREHELLLQKLEEAREVLPSSKNTEDLLSELNASAHKAGLVIRSLNLTKAETTHGFYAAIPIEMQIAGTYHEIASFFESISKLRRIVNISGISLTSARNESDRVVLTAKYLATTFRFTK